MMVSEIEIWKPIKGYESLYEISSLGRVKALPKEVIDRNGVIKKMSERILKHNVWGEYFFVVLHANKVGKTILVHRLVALHFISNSESKPQINHKDGNKLNNHFENLEWCTHKENMRHAFKLGLNRGRVGTENCKAKITEKEVIEILHLSKQGKIGKEIAAVYNLNTSTVNRIISRKYWKHVAAV